MNPNVDIVDILSLREFSPVPIADATEAWLTALCNPDNGTSYKTTLTQIAELISDIIGSGVIQPDQYYVVSGPGPLDPSAGGTTVNDPSLEGKVYSLELRGVGFLRKGVEWDNDVVGGGWRLLIATFQPQEFYTVHFHPQISPIISTPGAIGKFSDGVKLVMANTTLVDADYRKIIILNDGYQVTLAAGWPENVILSVSHNGTTNKQGTLMAPAGQFFAWNGSVTGTQLWLGKNEHVGLVRVGTIWYVVYDNLGYDKIGWIVPGRLPGANQIIAQGQTLLRADYPRVLDYLNRLNTDYPGVVMDAANWPLNKTFWGFGNGTTTIQVPDLRGYFPRWLDLGASIDVDRNNSGLGNKPGSNQNHQVIAHTHGSDDHNRLLQFSGQGTAVGFDPATGDSEPDLRSSAQLVSVGGSETRGINVGELPLINI